jgi:hypothetical protein
MRRHFSEEQIIGFLRVRPENPIQSLRLPRVFTGVDTSAPRRPVAVI